MDWIRKRALAGDLLTGTFLNLGSHVVVDVASRVGFDWLLLDLEHGAGDRPELLRQLQATTSGNSCPIVRLGGNDVTLCKRVLDLGALGIMVPWVNSAAEAEQAAQAIQYAPAGVRGASVFSRATGYGFEFDEYFAEANDNLLLITQLETPEAVKDAENIAAVPRVDVLFVGPMDLSVSMGIPRQFDHPDFNAALKSVVAACKKHGKAAGILAADPSLADRFIEMGFTFVAAGSDGSVLAAGMAKIAQQLNGRK